MTSINTAIENSEPYDGGPYQTESGWTTTFSLALSNGCIDRGNGLQVYSDEDGRQVKVRAGRYFLRGHIYTLTSDKIIPLGSNGSSQPRVDTIVVRLDTVNRLMYTDVLSSAPSVSAVAPNLTQISGGIWEEALADVSIYPSFTFIDPIYLHERRRWAGGGTPWTDYTPNVWGTSGMTAALHPHPHNRARYRVDGDTCFVSWLQSTSVTGTPSLSYGASLPIPAKYYGAVGTAMVQDYPDGLAYVEANSVGGRSPTGDIGLVILQKSNAFNLTPDTNYFGVS